MSQFPPPGLPPQYPGMLANLDPHRGVLLLVLGILSLVLGCFPLGIVSWVLGNNDLKSMAEGRMDPSGRGLTQAGKILGIVSVVLFSLGFLVWLLMLVLGIGMVAAGAAAGPGVPGSQP
ncbi:MAG: hypothetical protein SFZ23_14255 [Planctomycetota bacterium]|nr:hypothetical protein [Planctomycetota bacterium]